jgi:hypothetical protein
LFHNINGLKDENNWAQILTSLKDLDVTCFGLAEINTTMKGGILRRWQDMIRKLFNTSKTTTSESDITTESSYKPGGTSMTIVGKWHARVTEKGNDASGLGRWSYLIINSNKKKLAVITAYKPCKAQGPNTSWTQQWLLLREKQKDPDPIQEFYKDLGETLKQWRTTNHEIILMIDANEEIGKRPGGLGKVLAENELYDIIANQHHTDSYPPTYARGTKRIDYIFGTERIQKHCKASGILPLHIGYPSDHRPVFIRVDLQAVMATEIHPTESKATRLITSATPREREKFLHELDIHYQAQNLYERMSNLWNIQKENWTEENEQEYNACDEQHIIGMIAAEKKTCKEKRFAWSPAFSKAIEEKGFWKIILSLKRNCSRPSQRIHTWAVSLGIQDITKLTVSEANCKLREAQKNLREIKSRAAEYRENHLLELLSISSAERGDKRHAKRIQILLRAHRKHSTHTKSCNLF